jgi:glycosyltransferase involved in cell wall biosynthesis
MKICFITEFYDPNYGGQYTSLKGIIEQCKINKIDYEIIFKKSKIYNDKALLKKVLDSYDIFHIFGGWNWFYIKLSFKLLKLKKRILVHPMGFYEPWSLSQKKIKKYLAWKLYQNKFLLKANCIHCASEEEQSNILKLNDNLKTVILPFGINDKFLKKKIYTSDHKVKKKVLFFSRLHKKKGLDLLIKAWLEINNLDWTLDICGFGNNNKYLNKIISRKKNVKINFLKPIYNNSSKIKLFRKYDFLVLPTYNENFGLVILESLSRGLPVLTTTNTPFSIIEKINAGWVVNSNYVELKLVLYQILKISEKELIIKKKNSIKLARRFLWSKIFPYYINLYKKIMKVK